MRWQLCCFSLRVRHCAPANSVPAPSCGLFAAGPAAPQVIISLRGCIHVRLLDTVTGRQWMLRCMSKHIDRTCDLLLTL